MERALWVVAILGLSVAACGTPSAQPTGSAAANPTASSGSAASADPATLTFCTALDAHAANVTALRDLDPATLSVDQVKTAAAKARTTIKVLFAAVGAAGLVPVYGDEFERHPGTQLLDGIERLPNGATPQEVKQMLEAYAWQEGLTGQLAFYARLREAVCTNAPNPSAAS